MSNITIVTAFFDIGREKSDVHPRSIQQYFDYFAFWARIHNDLIIYCDPHNVDKIYSIRANYGLGQKTVVIPVENIYSIEANLFSRMEAISQSDTFRSFRYFDNALSNNARYDYIMMMKWWCMADAARHHATDGFFAWLDFGYNHGDAHYLKSEEFDFLWDYSFERKINAFCLRNPDDVASIDSLQFQIDCFIGGSLILPCDMCQIWWERIREAMWSLLALDCIDDDQQLILMVYKRYPEDFVLRSCNWFEAIQICSDQTFTIKTKPVPQPKQSAPTAPPPFVKRAYYKLRSLLPRKKAPEPVQLPDPFILRIEAKKKTYRG